MIIEVRKLDLAEGEEVLELGDKVMRALAQSKAKLKKSLRLIGIYNDHIITRDAETGRLFKMTLTRGDGAGITLGDPEEVQQSFATLTELREQKRLKDEAEKKAAKVMTETGETAGHKHEANVDAQGNGTTSSVNGHQHEVSGWEVAAAGTPPHTHALQQPEGEAEMKKPAKKSEGDDLSPEYVKIEKASLWKGVI